MSAPALLPRQAATGARALTPALCLVAWVGLLPALAGSHPAGAGHAARPADRSPIVQTVEQVQAKVVKVFGAGGFRGLEAYQSGLLISPEGHVLTAWSYVLDTDKIAVVLHDGKKLDAKLLGADPRLEVAVLKVEGKELPCFDLRQAVTAESGTRVLAFSNLFGVAVGNEPLSVQRGTIAVRTHLDARRGAFETPYNGPVYVVDMVTNNPGSAGGALVTCRGELVAMLGKELRSAANHTWLNYAVPIEQLRDSVDQIRAGKLVATPEEPTRPKPARALTFADLGISLVPDVLQRTPPYVDQVRPGSAAAKAGLRPDDLVVLLNDRLVPSCKALGAELEYVDHEDPVRLTVLRGPELLQFVLQASAGKP